MTRNMFLMSIGFIVSWFSFWNNEVSPSPGLLEETDENVGVFLQEGEIDKNRLYLDSMLWEQMMLEAERVSPTVAKMNYSNLRNDPNKGVPKKASGGNYVFSNTSGTAPHGSGSSNKELASYSTNTGSALPSQAEYDALMDFYQAMDGPNWYNNSGWSSADPNVVQDVSNFHGLTLDASGHVKWIMFWQNNLNGTIPESFGDLTYLEHIQMVRNPHIGQLPQSLGNLDKVVELLLYGNNMTGTIPGTIGNMTALENVHLYINNLTGSIPPSLTSLPNLEFFSVYDNNLTGVLPSNLGDLNKLTHFYINGNAITGSIPSSIGSMSAMKELYLYSNQLSGSIPTSIGNLSGLTRLYLNQNQLSGTLPASLGSLDNLQFFWLQDNNVTGQIPWEMGGLQLLDSFLAYRNSLTGSLPAVFGNIASLRQLRLDENQITGEIPPSYGNLVNINTLTLNDNKLIGSIPSSFCSFATISQLGLHNNRLEGDIPDCLLDKNITEFTVRYNYYNFEELAYSKTKIPNYYTYAPQYLKFVDTLYISSNTTVDLTYDDGNYQGSPSIYRWKKDGVWLHDASPTNDVISINCSSSGSQPCEGLYYLLVTNPDFAGAYLGGDIFYLKMAPGLDRTICTADELNRTVQLCI
ncbi:hypothetical protein [Algoriphagus sp. Y33]|uniref:hypothetical protein n=1 Tax=Algoriphagus sp. Y33 TaxID=2772483 RepID=UPI00177BFCFD|nr:hypothetical protein [Algoriphagus sp. Y33]